MLCCNQMAMLGIVKEGMQFLSQGYFQCFWSGNKVQSQIGPYSMFPPKMMWFILSFKNILIEMIYTTSFTWTL